MSGPDAGYGAVETQALASLPLRVGVDLVEVDRVARLLARYGERFARRIFTDGELVACRSHRTGQGPAGDQASLPWQPERLAARLAAKEAVAKALGSGIGPVAWCEIEVINDASGRPAIRLDGAAAAAAADLGLRAWAISLSHTRQHAIALVVATG